MKKLFSVILSVVLLFSLISCSTTDTQNSDSNSSLTSTKSNNSDTPSNETGKITYEGIDFEYQCIRTQFPNDDDLYKAGTSIWITNRNELIEYYNSHESESKILLFVGGISDPKTQSTDSKDFLDGIKKYDDAFFENKNLLIVWQRDGTGSVKHEVTDVLLGSSDKGQGKYYLQPSIKKTFPPACEDDMGFWNLIIELDKKYNPDSCELQEPKITIFSEQFEE